MATLDLPTSAAIPHHADRLTEPRDFAGVHRDVWAVLRSNPTVFVGLPVLLWLPFSIFAELRTVSFDDGASVLLFQLLNTVGGLGELVIDTFVPAVVLFALREGMHGKKVGAREALKGGLTMWGSVFSAMFAAGIYALLGFMLFIIPGFVASARASLAPVVTAFEGLTGSHALDRSIELVKGRGAGRILLWGMSAYCIYTVLALLCVGGAVWAQTPFGPFSSGILGALAAIPANLLMVGILIGTAIIYVDTVEVSASYPLGRELSKSDGTRISPPVASGTRGLVIAALLAGCALPLLAGTVAYALELDEAALAAEPSPALDYEVNEGDAQFDAMIDELEAEEG